MYNRIIFDMSREGKSSMAENRFEQFLKLWRLQDEAYDLMTEYDGIPHLYSDVLMYHAEGLIIDLIAEQPGITCTELANCTKKTPSACSQLVRKLKKRGCVEQVRNEKNNRIYNLYITESGREIYENRKIFNQKCQKIMYDMLKDFSDKEIEHHIKVQMQINEAYRGDVERSLAENKISH